MRRTVNPLPHSANGPIRTLYVTKVPSSSHRTWPGCRLRHRHHEAVEECCELDVGIKRQDVGDVLIGADNDDAALVAIDTAHVENVVAALKVGAEHLLVV